MAFNPFSLIFGLARSSNPLLAIAMDFASEALSHAGVDDHKARNAIAATQTTLVKRIDRELENHVASTVTVAPVKSSWFSSINWVALPLAVSGILALFGITVPMEVQTGAQQVFEGAVAIGGIYIWVKRTFFTRSLTHASVKTKE